MLDNNMSLLTRFVYLLSKNDVFIFNKNYLLKFFSILPKKKHFKTNLVLKTLITSIELLLVHQKHLNI